MISLVMLPFTILVSVAAFQKVLSFDRPIVSLLAMAGLALLYLLVIHLLQFVRFSANKESGTYRLERGYFGIPIKRQSGPLSDVGLVKLLVHEVEDPDTHTIRPHYHLYLRIGNIHEYLFELSGTLWQCLFQGRELSSFLGRGLQMGKGLMPGKEHDMMEESPDDVKASLAAMRDEKPDQETIIRSAPLGSKLRATAVTLCWTLLPYIVAPILAAACLWAILAVQGTQNGFALDRDSEEVLKVLLVIVVPLSMIVIRYLHAKKFAGWVEDNARYRRNFLRLCTVVFTVLFGLVAIHDYNGWEWLGMNNMGDYLRDAYWFFPIHVMQNYWFPDFWILLFLMRGTYRANLHKRMVEDEEKVTGHS
jgi:hypothetical protein